jgi:hypothetical protein
MKIDRSKFLLLTSAMFACGTKNDPSSASGGPIVIPAQPPPTASMPLPATAKLAEPAAPDAGPKEAQLVVDDDDEQPYEAWPGTANPPMAKTVKAQKCDVTENAKGKAVACTLKAPPGPSCESFSETRADCPKLTRWLVPRVAEKATACLNAKSGKKDICLFNVGPSCVIESLSSVCLNPDAKIEQSCDRVMKRCKTTDPKYRHMNMEACKAALSAILPAAHGKFTSCAAESCDLIPCMYSAAR